MAELSAKVEKGDILRTELEEKLAEEHNSWSRLEEEMTGGMAALRTQLSENADILESLHAQNATEQIAFFVHREENFGPVSVFTKIPFPNETVNIGGGWQSNIDVFQAPVNGHYFFFANIRSALDTLPHVRIVHTDMSGDHIVATLVSNGDYNCAANSGIIYLNMGDYVSVQLNSHQNGIVYSSGSKFTTFSGFLLT